jgi:hypothetical protein
MDDLSFYADTAGHLRGMTAVTFEVDGQSKTFAMPVDLDERLCEYPDDTAFMLGWTDGGLTFLRPIKVAAVKA